MRLFLEQGYSHTTVEQIAEAAEVSPSTFFRYFPTKEDVVIVDDFDALIAKAVLEVPESSSPLATVRAAMESALGQLTPEDHARENARRRLLNTEPDLRAAWLDELHRTIDVLAQGAAARFDRDAQDIATRVFAGALAGSVLAVTKLFDDGGSPFDAALDALRVLDEDRLELRMRSSTRNW